VRAYAVVTRVYDLPTLWRQIDALDNKVPTALADQLTLETRRLLDRASRWLLSNRPQPIPVGAEISRFSPVVGDLAPAVLDMLKGRARETALAERDRLVAAGVPEPLAIRVATLLDSYGLLDITEVVELAERGDGMDVECGPAEVAELYYTLSNHLDIDVMLTSVSALERGGRWHALARLSLRDDLYSSLRAITLDALRSSEPGQSAEQKIENWEQTNASRLSRARVALDEIRRSGRLDLATLSVAARQLRSMVR